MSDKELIARGAQVVTGDLILNNRLMGRYRNGVFQITSDGEYELSNIVDVKATDVTDVAPKPRAVKAKAQKVEAKPAPTLDEDDLVGSLNDILGS